MSNRTDYIAALDTRLTTLNDTSRKMLGGVDALILEEIIKIVNKAKVDGVSKSTYIKLMSRLYASETWERIQKRADRWVNSELKELRKEFATEIDALRVLYPESSFKGGSVDSFFLEVERESRKYSSNLRTLARGSRSGANVKFNTFQAGLLTNNRTGLIRYYQSYFTSLTRAQAKTEIVTFQNSVFNEMRLSYFSKMRDVPVYYEYIGPYDRLTRPFCKSLVGEVKTLPQWERVKNDFGQSVRSDRGGYNCRHALLPIRKINLNSK